MQEGPGRQRLRLPHQSPAQVHAAGRGAGQRALPPVGHRRLDAGQERGVPGRLRRAAGRPPGPRRGHGPAPGRRGVGGAPCPHHQTRGFSIRLCQPALVRKLPTGQLCLACVCSSHSARGDFAMHATAAACCLSPALLYGLCSCRPMISRTVPSFFAVLRYPAWVGNSIG